MDENKIKQLVTAAKSGDKNAQSTIKQIIDKAQNGDKDAQQVASIIQKYIKQKAAHGAKLQYFRSLKHQCADDEEPYYYKKGGSVDCGCKKKEGGEIQKAESGKKIPKIKWTNKDDHKLDSLSQREAKKQPITPQGKKDLKDLREKFKKSSNKKDYEVEEGKCGGKMKKHLNGGNLERLRKLLNLN